MQIPVLKACNITVLLYRNLFFLLKNFYLIINLNFNIMKKYSNTIKWTARIMTMAFAAFISIFAMDVFGEGYGFWKTLLALTMHLIPTFFIIIVLIFSWRWELVGTICFAFLGIAYLVWSWGRFQLDVYFLIAGPLFVVSTLFFISWLQKKQFKA